MCTRETLLAATAAAVANRPLASIDLEKDRSMALAVALGVLEQQFSVVGCLRRHDETTTGERDVSHFPQSSPRDSAGGAPAE
jgi:hypothetical protein